MAPESHSELLHDLNSKIDHTLLKPELSEPDIVRLCEQGIEYRFHAVCVYPCWIKTATEILRDSSVQVCSVVGFPSGSSRTRVKQLEAEMAIQDGATELDMVANIGWIQQEDWPRFARQVSAVRKIIPDGIIFKVIIESSILDSQRRREATRVLIDCGADFVKTSTGLREAVTPEEVADLKQAAGSAIKVKASGGIRTLVQCQDLLKAGADRIGTSSSVEIMQNLTLPT